MFEELTFDELVKRHHHVEERLMDLPEDENLFRRLDRLETRLRTERMQRLLDRQ